MLVKLSIAVRSALAETLIAQIDAATGPAMIEFYSGTQPDGPNTAVTNQVLLGTLTCSANSATQDAGVVTFAEIIQDAAADASGQVNWARLRDGAGVAVADFDVSNNQGPGAIKLNTVTIVRDGPIAIQSLTITMPGA